MPDPGAKLAATATTATAPNGRRRLIPLQCRKTGGISGQKRSPRGHNSVRGGCQMRGIAGLEHAEEVALVQWEQAVHLDLEIGLAVAVDIALDQRHVTALLEDMQLPGLVVEFLAADKMEILIAGTLFSVERFEIDLFVWVVAEIHDLVAACTFAGFLSAGEHERVGVSLAVENVGALAADQRVFAEAAADCPGLSAQAIEHVAAIAKADVPLDDATEIDDGVISVGRAIDAAFQRALIGEIERSGPRGEDSRTVGLDCTLVVHGQRAGGDVHASTA